MMQTARKNMETQQAQAGTALTRKNLIRFTRHIGIRPIADYAAVAWGLMITQEQSDKLEMYA